MARIVEHADGVVGLGKPFMEGPCRGKHIVAAGIEESVTSKPGPRSADVTASALPTAVATRGEPA